MMPLPMHEPDARRAQPAGAGAFPDPTVPDAQPSPSLADLFAPPVPSAAPAAALENPELRARVAKVIDDLRPYINADGGDISLVSVADGVVRVALHGACVGCSSSLYTLQLGVERRLREEVPGIRHVEAI